MDEGEDKKLSALSTHSKDNVEWRNRMGEREQRISLLWATSLVPSHWWDGLLDSTALKYEILWFYSPTFHPWIDPSLYCDLLIDASLLSTIQKREIEEGREGQEPRGLCVCGIIVTHSRTSLMAWRSLLPIQRPIAIHHITLCHMISNDTLQRSTVYHATWHIITWNSVTQIAKFRFHFDDNFRSRLFQESAKW